MNTLLLPPLVLLIDRLLGEPARFHPLVGFGRFAKHLENLLNKGNLRIYKGLLAWILAVAPITIFIVFLDSLFGKPGELWLSLLFGWLAIGWNSLIEHALAVRHALHRGNLSEARIKTSYLVSRDTGESNETELSRATIESILENTSDAIIAPLFWLLIFGAPGVVFYRLCNTLDAMWGYRNEPFEQFGKVTAKMDDVLNYLPARITALLFMLCGKSQDARKAWQTQGSQWYSPNAGVVMASGAGALNVRLGGAAIYAGQSKNRPTLGFSQEPAGEDIQRAIALMDRSLYCLIGFLLVMVVSGELWLVINQ